MREIDRQKILHDFHENLSKLERETTDAGAVFLVDGVAVVRLIGALADGTPSFDSLIVDQSRRVKLVTHGNANFAIASFDIRWEPDI